MKLIDVVELIEDLELMRQENAARVELGYAEAYSAEAFLAVIDEFLRRKEQRNG